MSEFRVLICGGRGWAHRDVLFLALDRIHRKHRIDLLIHGACRGADLMGEEWAKENEVDYVGCPAKWKTGQAAAAGRPKAEGVIRNARMLKRWPPTLVIGFHDALASSRGTKDMLNRAVAAGVPAWHATADAIVRYRGTP